MKKKRKRKARGKAKPLPPDIAELVRQYRVAFPHLVHLWDINPNVSADPFNEFFRKLGRELLKHARAGTLAQVASALERVRMQIERVSSKRQAVVCAWNMLANTSRQPVTYKELTHAVCWILGCEWTDKLYRAVRYIADDLKLPVKTWRLQ